MKQQLASLALLAAVLIAAAPPEPIANAPRVEVARVPNSGLQPQAVVGADGTVHLLYYKGDPAAGDLFYVKRSPGQAEWTAPLRVNSQERSAVAVGNDRGGHMAVGRNGIVHVAWNGSDKAAPKAPQGSCPMLYSRLLPAAGTSSPGTAPAAPPSFQPQRNMMAACSQLDGGGSVAADQAGNVYVVWHALPNDAADKSEAGRRVLIARSTDDGATFAPETPINDSKAGTCGCCGLKAAALPSGEVVVLYRSATEDVHRDMRLLHSSDAGKSFMDTKIDEWHISSCPMSTESIVAAPSAGGTLLAWDTEGVVRWTVLPANAGVPDPVRTHGAKGGTRKYPVTAVNSSGQVLIAWTEGMAWSKGGKAHWQMFTANGKPIENSSGSSEGVPAWGLVAAVAKPDGSFVILY